MAEHGIRERLVGCWRLAGYAVTTAGGGETDHPIGYHPLELSRLGQPPAVPDRRLTVPNSEGVTIMTTTTPAVTSYSVNRLTVDVPAPVEQFQQQYEQAVPSVPMEQVNALVARVAPWSEMTRLIDKARP